MKEFNKEKELNKLRLKNNKSKYIKYGSIVLSTLLLVVGIIYFTFAKFESNKSYTLIEGRIGDYSTGDITLSYVVDGIKQDTPPGKNDGYKFKSISCTNGDGTWLNDKWGVEVVNLTGKVKCNLEFETPSTAVEYINSIGSTDDSLLTDGTVDNNLRYVGSNPNNYVKFNDELWRIIGVMNNIKTGGGTTESLVKIIRSDGLGVYSWIHLHLQLMEVME